MTRDSKPLKPGWKITQGQWATFWRLWGAAYKAQGWDRLPAAERDAKRKEVLLGLGFASATLVDKTKGFDAVKRKFEQLASVVHADGEDAGDKRRLLSRIGEVYSEMAEASYPESMLNKILKDFRVIPGVRDIAELSPQALLTLSRTLTRNLAEWNDRAGQHL